MNDKEADILNFTLIISACLVSIQAISWVLFGASKLLSLLSAQHISWIFAEEMISRNRAFIPFILPAILGGYLIMHLPLTISLHKKHYKNIDIPLFKRPLQNSIFLSAIILMLVALLLTKAIGPLISLLLSFLIVFFLSRSSISKILKIIICFLGIALFFIILVRSHDVGYWKNPLFSFAQRQMYWTNTWTIICQHPFIGTGPGNMPFVGSQFSHNSYLQIWAESGLFALVGFLNIIFYAFSKILKAKNLSESLALWLWVSVLGFLIHNLIDFTFFLPETAIIWWTILALCCRQQLADKKLRNLK